MLSECLWISSISDSDHGSPSKWSNLDAILAFPARNLAILPLTQRGDLLTWGIEKITDPCLGGGAPRRCAAIAACAPSTCIEPEGILASLSLPPAITQSFAAPSGPTSLDRLGRYSLATLRMASSLDFRLLEMSMHLLAVSWIALHSGPEGAWGGLSVPKRSAVPARSCDSAIATGILSLSLSRSNVGRRRPAHSMHLASTVVQAERNSDCEDTNMSNRRSIFPAASATPF